MISVPALLGFTVQEKEKQSETRRDKAKLGEMM